MLIHATAMEILWRSIVITAVGPDSKPGVLEAAGLLDMATVEDSLSGFICGAEGGSTFRELTSMAADDTPTRTGRTTITMSFSIAMRPLFTIALYFMAGLITRGPLPFISTGDGIAIPGMQVMAITTSRIRSIPAPHCG